MLYSTLAISALLTTSLVVAAPTRQHRSAAPTPADIESLLATVTDHSILTLPCNVFPAFQTLADGGKLSAEETKALGDCTTAARANNTASKVGLGKSLAANIAFDA